MKRFNVEIIRKLQGHSGCEVFLCRRKDEFTVIKSSSDQSYNNRLMSQMSKQEIFYHKSIKKPKVLRSGIEKQDKKEIFWFEMEYISGLPFFQYIETAGREEATAKFKKILNFINGNNALQENIESEVKEKIDSLEKILDTDKKYYLDYVKDFEWNRIKKSYSHGDLTFENIIVSKGDIHFIDFLDTFGSSKIIDYSKLMQDLVFGWSWRQKGKIPFVDLMIMERTLRGDLSEFDLSACKKMLVLNILRIIPYSKDKSFLLDCLDYIEREFKNE